MPCPTRRRAFHGWVRAHVAERANKTHDLNLEIMKDSNMFMQMLHLHEENEAAVNCTSSSLAPPFRLPSSGCSA